MFSEKQSLSSAKATLAKELQRQKAEHALLVSSSSSFGKIGFGIKRKYAVQDHEFADDGDGVSVTARNNASAPLPPPPSPEKTAVSKSVLTSLVAYPSSDDDDGGDE